MHASVSITNVSKVFPAPPVAAAGRRQRVRHVRRAGDPRAVPAVAGLEVLRDITVDIRPGEFLSVLGPSGCGKTTLLRIVGGLAEPTSGTVRIGNRTAAEAQRHKSVGYVFQEPSLLPWRTVLDNVRLPLVVNRAAQRPGAMRPRNCFTWCGWRSSPATIRANCRAACSSGSAWRGRWRSTRRCC